MRKALMNWLNGGNAPMAYPSAQDPSSVAGQMLSSLTSRENPASFAVMPIQNGFLICRRTYNPQGPDTVEATFSAAAEDLGPMLVAAMSAQRLRK